MTKLKLRWFRLILSFVDLITKANSNSNDIFEEKNDGNKVDKRGSIYSRNIVCIDVVIPKRSTQK